MNDLVEMILLYIAKYARLKLSEKIKTDQQLSSTFHTGRRSRCSAVA